MSQFYSDPDRELNDHALPDAEVFYLTRQEALKVFDVDADVEAGWYYWFCFPGCLPDSEPEGPFETEQEAIDDCQSFAVEG